MGLAALLLLITSVVGVENVPLTISVNHSRPVKHGGKINQIERLVSTAIHRWRRKQQQPSNVSYLVSFEFFHSWGFTKGRRRTVATPVVGPCRRLLSLRSHSVSDTTSPATILSSKLRPPPLPDRRR